MSHTVLISSNITFKDMLTILKVARGETPKRGILFCPKICREHFCLLLRHEHAVKMIRHCEPCQISSQFFLNLPDLPATLPIFAVLHDLHVVFSFFFPHIIVWGSCF